MIDVKYLASLAKLTVTDDEAKTLQAGFIKTIEAVKLLKHLDISKVKPITQVSGLSNVFREDKIDLKRLLTQKQALSNAHKTSDGYFVIDPILYET